MSFARTLPFARTISLAGIGIPLLLAGLALAGCAQQKEEVFPTTNPLQKKCEAQGAQAGDAMTACMRREAAVGMGTTACARKGLKAGTARGDACIKNEADYAEAESLCQAAGRIASQADYDACVAEKAPQAVAARAGR